MAKGRKSGFSPLRLVRRLFLFLFFAAFLYAAVCEGLRAFLVCAVNDPQDRYRCQLYFNVLWLRPDFTIELREVAFVTNLGPVPWTAERAELRLKFPALPFREAWFGSMKLYDARFSFYLSQIATSPQDKRIDALIERWRKKEFDSRWTIRIDELDVFDGRVDFIDDRPERDLSAPASIFIRDVRASARSFAYPLRSIPVGFNFKGTLLQGAGCPPGRLSALGITYPVSRDTDADISVRDVAVDSVRPILSPAAAKSLKRGVMDITAKVKIKDRRYDFPCEVALRDCAISPETSLFNIPYKVLSSVLVESDSSMELVFDVGGTLDAPEYKLRNELGHSISYGVGNTITRGAKTVFGVGRFAVKSVGGVLSYPFRKLSDRKNQPAKLDTSSVAGHGEGEEDETFPVQSGVELEEDPAEHTAGGN